MKQAALLRKSGLAAVAAAAAAAAAAANGGAGDATATNGQDLQQQQQQQPQGLEQLLSASRYGHIKKAPLTIYFSLHLNSIISLPRVAAAGQHALMANQVRTVSFRRVVIPR